MGTTIPLKHFVDFSRCIQPVRRMRQFYEPNDMPRDELGRIDWSRLEASGERLWIASTECGLGFSGSGAFPHDRLQHGLSNDDEEPDSDPLWCKKCLGEKWGIKPQNRAYTEPDLRDEFTAWDLAKKR